MELALTELFLAKWTDAIHDEWMNSLLAKRPDLRREKLARTRETMNAAVPDCLVDGYQDLVASLVLPDPDDRHVLAAAIRAGGTTIVTFNLQDFPTDALIPHGVAARHPDDFVTRLFEQNPVEVSSAIERQRRRLQKPSKSREEFFATPAFQQLPEFLDSLRRFFSPPTAREE